MYEIFEGANGYYVAYVDSNGRRRWNEGDDRSHHGWDREAAEQELLRYRMFAGATGVSEDESDLDIVAKWEDADE